jgi:hypothetical protein
MKSGLPDVPTWQEFLSKVSVYLVPMSSSLPMSVKDIEKGSRIGIDASLISAGNYYTSTLRP